MNLPKSVWTLAILLIVVSVARTRNHIPSTDYSLCYYHHNHCYRHYRGQLQTANYYSSSFTHLLGDFVNKSLNNTCLHDTLSFVELSESNSNLQDTINEDHLQRSPKNGINGSSAYKKDTSIPNSFFNRINDSIGDSYSLQTRSTVTANVTSSFRRKSDGRLWKRRTLCSVFDDEKYSAETAFQKDVFSDVDEKESAGEKKTLSDYDGSIFMSNVDDSDSLKAHVRVKRSESESNPRSSVAYQQDYLKDLANSFPHNSYESIDENSYDDDTSFDAKREIKSQEYFANDEQSVGPVPGKVGFENAPIPPSSNSDESLANIPLDDNKGNKLVEKNVDLSQGENQETMLEEPSKKLISFAEQQLQNMDSDMSSLPRDPMLAVELVRKKRDDYGKARSKEISDEKASLFGSLDDGQIIPLPLSSQDNQKNVLDSNDKKIGSCKEGNRLVYSEKHKRALNGHRKPFSMAIAGLKADLLRFKRRAKNGKTSKSKKKRKHVEKKHDSSRTRKMVRKKNAIESRVARERKNSETSGEGKSKVGIARVVSKKNNQNNFRRRSVKAKKSIEATDSANDRSSVRVRAKKIDENVVDDGSALSLAVLSGSDASDAKADEKGDSLARNENQLAFESERSMKEGTKLRTKRDKHAETNHGFADEEDELRYYENIREPEPEKAQCPNRDENPRSSEGNEAEGGRAARSIEEMKELVKKLVTKVSELENYLSVDEAKSNSDGMKRIEARAIDDLCSNVTPTDAILKEAPKIVQRCASFGSTSHEFTSTAKAVVERNAEPDGSVNRGKRVKEKSVKSGEKKRSARERVARTSSSTSKTVRRDNEKGGRKWGRWTDWSSCSVTCGKGRQIRWRYCLHDCSTAETEMEEKACQLPACPPGKFLGIF